MLDRIISHCFIPSPHCSFPTPSYSMVSMEADHLSVFLPVARTCVSYRLIAVRSYTTIYWPPNLTTCLTWSSPIIRSALDHLLHVQLQYLRSCLFLNFDFGPNSISLRRLRNYRCLHSSLLFACCLQVPCVRSPTCLPLLISFQLPSEASSQLLSE